MRKQTDRFQFKQFVVKHSQSSMKVGIDSILLGSWASVDGAKKILDVGMGCGILALMCAQRNREAIIDGIDIDFNSVEESQFNFKSSPWSERVSAIHSDYLDFNEQGYDMIISNPPFFNSGVNKIVNARERARHQDSLSPKTLIEKGATLINSEGIVSMIIPLEQKDELIQFALTLGMGLKRLAVVRGRKYLSPKRAMMEFMRKGCDNFAAPIDESEIVIEEAPGQPTEQFRSLCKDFYLDF